MTLFKVWKFFEYLSCLHLVVRILETVGKNSTIRLMYLRKRCSVNIVEGCLDRYRDKQQYYVLASFTHHHEYIYYHYYPYHLSGSSWSAGGAGAVENASIVAWTSLAAPIPNDQEKVIDCGRALWCRRIFIMLTYPLWEPAAWSYDTLNV